MKRLHGVVAVCLIPLCAAAASLNEGVEFYEKGAYIKAFDTFLTLAKEGDAKARYNVALMYERGQGVKRDIHEAMRWYKQAAKAGRAKAAYNLGVLIEKTKQAHWEETARYWYEKAVEDDVKEAYNNLALFYLEGIGTAKNPNKALDLLKKGAKKGDPVAMLNLGIAYLKGTWGIEEDKLKAYEWLTKAFRLGRKEAETYLETLCKSSPWACQNSGI